MESNHRISQQFLGFWSFSWFTLGVSWVLSVFGSVENICQHCFKLWRNYTTTSKILLQVKDIIYGILIHFKTYWNSGNMLRISRKIRTTTNSLDNILYQLTLFYLVLLPCSSSILILIEMFMINPNQAFYVYYKLHSPHRKPKVFFACTIIFIAWMLRMHLVFSARTSQQSGKLNKLYGMDKLK